MGISHIHQKIKKLPSSLLLALGFFCIILLGTFLLMLPFSTTKAISPIDALFIATSAVCVTGLSPIEICSTLTLFGQIVLMSLFQIGGLGYAILLVSLITITNGTLSFKNKLLVRESFGVDNRTNTKEIIKFVLISTFICEALGTILLSVAFFPQYGNRGIFIALFTAVSAFNNAGFDLFGNSLIAYNNSALVLLTVASLIIIGGLGFLVLKELIIPQRHRIRLSVHTKIVLLMTIILLLSGTVGFIITQKLSVLEAFFQAVTTRTAGFCSFDQSILTPKAYVLTIFLMFIGASPCSTGGGIKTTTLFTALGSCFSLLKGKDFIVFKRYISKDTVIKALFIFLVAVLMIFFSCMILSFSEPDIPLSALFYEVVSALATVGLSQNITSLLSVTSKIIIIFLMYIGRVGILTILSCFSSEAKHIEYLEGKVIVG